MEIYLIRHTTPAIEKGICYGQVNLDLAQSFKNEVAKILKTNNLNNISKVYSSPLKRCTKLALKFSKNLETDSRLMELSFGDWELKKWDDIPKSEIDPWMNDFVNVKVPNGESYIQLAERANDVFTEIIKKNTNSKKIIIVTHSGIIRSIIAKITNVSLINSFDIKIEYGQLFKIKKQNNILKLT